MEDNTMKQNRIFNYMKVASLCGVLTLMATSCSDDFFNIENPNEVSTNNFWKSEDDALMALTSCYDAMQDGDLNNDDVNGWKFGFLTRETCTDNGGHTWGNWMLGSSIAQGTSTANDECFSKYWNTNYELIKRCNALIEKVDGINMSNEKKAAYKGEAIALRALAYCNLVSVFRDVPYLEKPLTLAECQPARNTKEEIATKILADLKTNIPYIPVKGKAEKGRLTQEGAYAIMGRLALFTKHYDESIEAYNNVIGKYRLFKSGDGLDGYKNYSELFCEKNEECDEIILGVHYVGPGLNEGQKFGICWGTPMNAIEATRNLCDDYYCTDGLPIDKSPLFKGKTGKAAYDKDHPDFARYENRDPRLKGTLFVPGMKWLDDTYDYDKDTNPNGKKVPSASQVAIMKWYVPEDLANNEDHKADGSLDYYVIRYAEVLLSLSEAMIEKGGYNQADITKYINEVRERVHMPKVEDVEGTGLSQEQLRQIVRHERRVELAFEDLRFADLYRWGEWKNSIDRMNKEYETYGMGDYTRFYRGAKDEVWPIPQNEIDTDLNLKQHKEWGGE